LPLWIFGQGFFPSSGSLFCGVTPAAAAKRRKHVDHLHHFLSFCAPFGMAGFRIAGTLVPPSQVVGLLAPQPLAYARGSAPEAGAHAAVERNVLSRARKQAV
jgi:hypothetical protein